MIMKVKRTTILDVLRRFKLESLVIGSNCATMTLSYTNWDSEAAWQLFVELITRVTSQPLPESDGDEKSALNSVYSLFSITRDILKNYGKNARSFTPFTILILNKLLRPFTSKWHKESLNNAFQKDETRKLFRSELEELRVSLMHYIQLLADMAGVDDSFII